jgi:hypothetical protein
MRLTAASEAASDVVGQRQRSFDDRVALTAVRDRPLVKGTQDPEHVRDNCVVGVQIRHLGLQSAPRDRGSDLNLWRVLYPYGPLNETSEC